MNKTKEEIIDYLSVLGAFILSDCHEWEQQYKGHYETRRTGKYDPETKDYVLQGSGLCTKTYNQIQEFINELKNDRGNDKSQA